MHPYSRLREWFADFVFPQIVCILCENGPAQKSGLCAECESQMHVAPLLREGQKQQAYTAAVSVFAYDGVARDYVLLLKKGRWDLPSAFFADHMAEVLRNTGWEYDVLTPVPLSYFKHCLRGYNQSEKLAERIAQNVGKPCRNLLKAKGGRQQQKLLNREARQENRKNAYFCTLDLTDQTIVLVDDVMTTGATVQACAKVLRDAGAKAVYVVTALYV